MRKTLNIISIFIMLLALISGVFFVGEDSEVLLAAEEEENNNIECSNGSTMNISCTNQYKNGSDVIGIVTISPQGGISFQYKYGISEILILTEGSRNGQTLTPKILHVSGTRNEDSNCVMSTNELSTNKCPSRTVHLLNYYEYNDTVKLSMVFEFASSFSDDFFKPIYCNVGNSNCLKVEEKDSSDYDEINKSRYLTNRIKMFAADKGISKYESLSLAGAKLVYSGVSGYNKIQVNYTYVNDEGETVTDLADVYYPKNSGVSNDYKLSNITITSVDNSAIAGASAGVDVLIYDTIIPTLLILLGIAAGVTCAILGYQIIKSSDEPQERQEKIQRLKSILLGIAIAFIILAAIEPVSKLISKYMGEQ